MNPSTAIIFDLGKVLLDFDYAIAARKIAAHSEHPPENLHGFLGNSKWLAEYENGDLTRQEFFDAVNGAIGFRGNVTEFGNYFGDIFTPIEPMIALHAEVRKAGFAAYIFSNTNDLAIEQVRKKFPFFKDFDGHVFSYEVHSMKPLARIYEEMEKKSGKSGADLIYIDDRPENIATADARGWQTILHETPGKTRGLLMKKLNLA
jgi:FMN phosphatase YigB (HAD superfamily)